MTTTKTCECESLRCHAPHDGPCPSPRGKVRTIYGTRLCDACAADLPERFIAKLPRLFTWRHTEWGPRVDVRLSDMYTTTDIFWSASKNSYVLVELPADHQHLQHPEVLAQYYFQRKGVWFTLVSINGAGEVRWGVPKDGLERDEEYEEQCEAEGRAHHGDGVEQLAAARHFNLIPAR